MVFLQSNVIMPGGHLLTTENKESCQISGLKSGRNLVALNIWEVVAYKSFWNSIWLRNEMVIYKVVAYRRWVAYEKWSGRYERIDGTR